MLQIQSFSILKSVLYSSSYIALTKKFVCARVCVRVFYEKYLLSAFFSLLFIEVVIDYVMCNMCNKCNSGDKAVTYSLNKHILRSDIIFYQLPSFVLYSDCGSPNRCAKGKKVQEKVVNFSCLFLLKIPILFMF